MIKYNLRISLKKSPLLYRPLAPSPLSPSSTHTRTRLSGSRAPLAVKVKYRHQVGHHCPHQHAGVASPTNLRHTAPPKRRVSSTFQYCSGIEREGQLSLPHIIRMKKAYPYLLCIDCHSTRDSTLATPILRSIAQSGRIEYRQYWVKISPAARVI